MYPDALLPTWRSSRFSCNVNKANDNYIRIWHEQWKSHVHLKKITVDEFPNYEGDTIYVDFTYRDHSANDHGTVGIRCYINGEFLKSEINNKNREDSLRCYPEIFGGTGMYAIERIVKSPTYEN